jgi:hypothetical protein
MHAIVVRVALLLFIVAAARPAPVARGGEPTCCAHCGCHCCLKPVCRIVCETKEVKETVYECACEDFCVPGPSKQVGCYCETDPNCPCHIEQKPIYKPCWCDMFHRKKLVKKEIVKEVPVYKCVVEYVCADCCGRCGGGHCGEPTQACSAGQAQVLTPLPPAPIAPAVRQSPVDAPPLPSDARTVSTRAASTHDDDGSASAEVRPRSVLWLLKD